MDTKDRAKEKGVHWKALAFFRNQLNIRYKIHTRMRSALHSPCAHPAGREEPNWQNAARAKGNCWFAFHPVLFCREAPAAWYYWEWITTAQNKQTNKSGRAERLWTESPRDWKELQWLLLQPWGDQTSWEREGNFPLFHSSWKHFMQWNVPKHAKY